MTTKAKVQFNSIDEFLMEIGEDQKRISRSIVRVTCLRTTQSNYVNLSVLATAIVVGVLVRLDYPIGQCFALDEVTFSSLATKSVEVMARIRAELTKLGLDVRQGLFE